MAARKLRPAEPEKSQNDQPAGDTSWRNGVPEAGWYKYPDAWWRDLPRLQRGLYQRMLIEYVWGTTVPRRKGEGMPEKSPWLSYVEMAAVFRCSPEQVRDDARDAAKRGLMPLEESRGKVRFTIAWERWPNLKDYVAPRPVKVPEKVQKQVRWLSRAVSVEPGATFDLPKLDFAVERISLRNTSAEGTIRIGAGSCEGGVLVLETNAELVSKKTKQVIEPERDSTPASFAKPSPKSKEKIATNPVVQQIAEGLSTYDPVTIPAVLGLIKRCDATPERVLESFVAIRPFAPEGASAGWFIRMIPQNIAGTYNPGQPKKKLSARDQRMADAFRMSREIKEGKIA